MRPSSLRPLRHLTILMPLVLAGAVAATVLRSPITPSQAASPAGHAATASATPIPAPAPQLGGTPREPDGVPAIAPSLAATQAATATYTLGDVQRFVAAHPFRTTDGSAPLIARILFIPASQASALMHGESIGRAPTELVCYVELHGSFSLDGISAPPVQGSLQPAHVGDMVFDAHTGNLLVAGFDG